MNKIQSCIDDMRKIHSNLLDFIENKEQVDEKFNKLLLCINDLKICDDKHKFKLLLHLIAKITNYLHDSNFFNKIYRLLTHFKDQIKHYFSNREIFMIFSFSKEIILFLIEEKLFAFDKDIASLITKNRYEEYGYQFYFYPEISPFLSEDKKLNLIKYLNNPYGRENVEVSTELPKDFFENRKIGENENYICKLIRNDSIDDFIVYLNKNNLSGNEPIKYSIYEANQFLYINQVHLIEYAAFYGSINIFNYLKNKEVELYPLLWECAIHGNNAEIISILEENNIVPEDATFRDCFKEAIKCHHNEMASYIANNLLQKNENEKDMYDYRIITTNPVNCGFEYYNFAFVQNVQFNDEVFFYLCKYDYYPIVDNLLKDKEIENINVNKTIVTLFFRYSNWVSKIKFMQFVIYFFNLI